MADEKETDRRIDGSTDVQVANCTPAYDDLLADSAISKGMVLLFPYFGGALKQLMKTNGAGRNEAGSYQPVMAPLGNLSASYI